MAAPNTTDATTLEQQLMEICKESQAAIEAFVTANPESDIQGMSVSENIRLDLNRITYTVVIPVTITESNDGGFSVAAAPVLASI